MKNIIAFADEYGNNSFEFSSQGTHFIVASVILKKEKLAECQIKLTKPCQYILDILLCFDRLAAARGIELGQTPTDCVGCNANDKEAEPKISLGRLPQYYPGFEAKAAYNR